VCRRSASGSQRSGKRRTRAKNAVNSTRFRALTLELAAWLQAGQWTTPQDDLVRDRGDFTITVFAAEQLTRRWRKLRKKRQPLAQLEAPGRHKLRIQTKKLRSAVEFFASLFASRRQVKRRRSLLTALEQLQDSLGELNDIAVDEQRLTAMGIRRGSNPNRIFAAGLLTGRENARTGAAMTAATKAHEELTKVKPFWR
jgi:triphosphatase